MPIAKSRVPGWVVDDIVDMVRDHKLDGEDLHDIAVSVDAGEPDFTGAGVILWSYLRAVTSVARMASAADLISEACVCLGWPVTT